VRRGWQIRLCFLCNIPDRRDIDAVERECHQRYALDAFATLQTAELEPAGS
jgi:hypothetical protein